MNKRQLRNRIIKRLHKMRDELEQTIRDIGWWNDNRTDAPPFDLGFELVMVDCVKKQIEAWEMDDMEAVNRWQSRMNEITASFV